MAVRLCNENLSQVSSNFFSVPSYDRSAMKSGILHIGPSAFFRSHLAVYADNLLQRQHERGEPLTWGITAVSIKTPHVRDAIAPQDFLYTLVAKGKDHLNGSVIGSVRDILVAQENPQAVLEAAADPDIKVISLTVTQNGYYYDKKKGFVFDHPDIQADLKSTHNEAMSSIGLIVSALDLRRMRGLPPPTILSCDNFAGNGAILKGAVLAYAKEKSSALHDWIGQHVRFPNTMVDRITPSLSDQHAAFVETLGVADRWPVEAEPMPSMPFAIEKEASIDPKTGVEVETPDFGSLGAVIGHSVSAYELLKLRSLNGAHMALGCIGHLAGFKHSFEAMKDPDLRKFIVGFMNEVGQTLDETPGVDQAEYRSDLLSRLDNDQIADPLTRLARNGSQKVDSRFLAPLRHTVSHPEQTRSHLTFALASWVHYLKQLDSEGYLAGQAKVNEKGEKTEPNDKNAALLNLPTLVKNGTTDPTALFAVADIFGADFNRNNAIVAEVHDYVKAIKEKGIQVALQEFVGNPPRASVDATADKGSVLDAIIPAGEPTLRPS